MNLRPPVSVAVRPTCPDGPGLPPMRPRRHRRRNFQHGGRLETTESTEADCLPHCPARTLRVLRALQSSSVLKESLASSSGPARHGRTVGARLAASPRATAGERRRRGNTPCTVRAGRPGPSMSTPICVTPGRTSCSQARGRRTCCANLSQVAADKTLCTLATDRSDPTIRAPSGVTTGKTPCTLRNCSPRGGRVPCIGSPRRTSAARRRVAVVCYRAAEPLCHPGTGVAAIARPRGKTLCTVSRACPRGRRRRVTRAATAGSPSTRAATSAQTRGKTLCTVSRTRSTGPRRRATRAAATRAPGTRSTGIRRPPRAPRSQAATRHAQSQRILPMPPRTAP